MIDKNLFVYPEILKPLFWKKNSKVLEQTTYLVEQADHHGSKVVPCQPEGKSCAIYSGHYQ